MWTNFLIKIHDHKKHIHQFSVLDPHRGRRSLLESVRQGARGEGHPGLVASRSQGWQRDSQPFTATHVINSYSSTEVTTMYLGCGKKREHPQNTHAHRINMQAPHKKVGAKIWTVNTLAVSQQCYLLYSRFYNKKSGPSISKAMYCFPCFSIDTKWLSKLYQVTHTHIRKTKQTDVVSRVPWLCLCQKCVITFRSQMIFKILKYEKQITSNYKDHFTDK